MIQVPVVQMVRVMRKKQSLREMKRLSRTKTRKLKLAVSAVALHWVMKSCS